MQPYLVECHIFDTRGLNWESFSNYGNFVDFKIQHSTLASVMEIDCFHQAAGFSFLVNFLLGQSPSVFWYIWLNFHLLLGRAV